MIKCKYFLQIQRI